MHTVCYFRISKPAAQHRFLSRIQMASQGKKCQPWGVLDCWWWLRLSDGRVLQAWSQGFSCAIVLNLASVLSAF